MIDLEHELRELYTDIDDDHGAAERIRSTLATRRRSSGSAWAVGAAAAAAACVAVGAVALRSDERPAPGAGAAPSSCTTALPAEWQRALDTTPITVDGAPAYPIMLTAPGDVIVAWKPAGGSAQLGITGADGTTRTFIGALGDHLGGGYALEGNTLVVGPTNSGSAMSVVDVQSGNTHEISLDPFMPAGYSASDGVAILNGVIYFGASPRPDGIGGVIVGYDLASGTSDIVARTDGPVFVRQDARGVIWKNGGIRATETPNAVPGVCRRVRRLRRRHGLRLERQLADEPRGQLDRRQRHDPIVHRAVARPSRCSADSDGRIRPLRAAQPLLGSPPVAGRPRSARRARHPNRGGRRPGRPAG